MVETKGFTRRTTGHFESYDETHVKGYINIGGI